MSMKLSFILYDSRTKKIFHIVVASEFSISEEIKDLKVSMKGHGHCILMTDFLQRNQCINVNFDSSSLCRLYGRKEIEIERKLSGKDTGSVLFLQGGQKDEFF